MSTVPEIEAAIEKLPPAELRELITWIEDYGLSEILSAGITSLSLPELIKLDLVKVQV
jgi:hypothetical protein